MIEIHSDSLIGFGFSVENLCEGGGEGGGGGGGGGGGEEGNESWGLGTRVGGWERELEVGNKSWDWERELGVGNDPMTSAIPYRERSFQDFLV